MVTTKKTVIPKFCNQNCICSGMSLTLIIESLSFYYNYPISEGVLVSP